MQNGLILFGMVKWLQISQSWTEMSEQLLLRHKLEDNTSTFFFKNVFMHLKIKFKIL